jgi:pyoverdine/dityrosine biosynthesis protein Dit1/GNAT superfamily N-acetyltransferase
MNHNSMPEPFGNNAPETKIERFWKVAQGTVGLRRTRTLAYDANALMTYAPMEYHLEPFQLDTAPPANDWIRTHFCEFVRTEFSRRSVPNQPAAFAPVVLRRIPVPDSFLDDLLSESESLEVPTVQDVVNASAADIASHVFDILCNPAFGAAANKRNNDRESFVNEVVPAIKDESRLLLVLPGFPFKDQNVFRVPYGADQPDCAELALLFRLHRLTQAIYQVHPYGADVVVLTDGSLYSKLFGVSDDDVARYMQRLRDYRNRMNLQGTVSFIPLKDLIDRASTAQAGLTAWSVADAILERLTGLIVAHSDVRDAFEALSKGMKWNLATRARFDDIEPLIRWRLLRDDEHSVDAAHRQLWGLLDHEARTAALQYASVNLMLRWLDLIRRFFPNAVRGTIHPKPGQFALAGTGNTFPWNGVAWCDNWPTHTDDVRVRPYFTLAELDAVEEMYFADTELPAFFAGTTHANVVLARSVLPRSGWMQGTVLGREFTECDLESLVALSSDDPAFSWSGKATDAADCARLLRFRISHYRHFAFGVHSLWEDGRLVGQCGLQVLDERADEIELAIFLGKEFTKQGRGSALADHIIRRCRDVGLKTIYGVVRPENAAGLALIRRLRGYEMARIEHFGCEAIKFRLDLS